MAILLQNFTFIENLHAMCEFNPMIDFATAKRHVLEAERRYKVAVSEGNQAALTQAREHVQSGRCSLDDLALWAVAECCNPSPIQDLLDFRYSAQTNPDSSDVVSMKRFFVAVFQRLSEESLVGKYAQYSTF